jgi:hypothetical protein
MNLNNLNLVELNAFDTIEVNGGELPYTENAIDRNAVNNLIKGVKYTLGALSGLRDGLMSAFN